MMTITHPTEPVHSSYELPKKQYEDQPIRFILMISMAIAFTFVFVSTTGLNMMKHDTSMKIGTEDYKLQYGMFKSCMCIEAKNGICHTPMSHQEATWGFSIIAVVLEGIALIAMCFESAFPKKIGKAHGWIQFGLMFIIMSSLFISFATFTRFWYSGTCSGFPVGQTTAGDSDKLVKDLTDLNFSYGIRIGEAVWALCLCIYWGISSYGDTPITGTATRVACFMTLILLALTYLTTTTHMWAKGTVAYKMQGTVATSTEFTIGPHQTCAHCMDSSDFQCDMQRHLFRVSQAFAICSIFFTAVLFTMHLFKLKIAAGAYFAISFFTFLFLCIAWIPWGAFNHQDFCGGGHKMRGELDWGFALTVAASGLQLFHCLMCFLQIFDVAVDHDADTEMTTRP